MWLTEWLAEATDLHSGMHVLDPGCGRGASSILHAPRVRRPDVEATMRRRRH
jgi:cyclopropane fatty-acyl-phospholipid synthase-like methyltransferase